jgi:chromosome segregation ATPase
LIATVVFSLIIPALAAISAAHFQSVAAKAKDDAFLAQQEVLKAMTVKAGMEGEIEILKLGKTSLEKDKSALERTIEDQKQSTDDLLALKTQLEGDLTNLRDEQDRRANELAATNAALEKANEELLQMRQQIANLQPQNDTAISVAPPNTRKKIDDLVMQLFDGPGRSEAYDALTGKQYRMTDYTLTKILRKRRGDWHLKGSKSAHFITS